MTGDDRSARLDVQMLPRLLTELLAVVAPPACAACRVPLGRADALVCAACLRALPWLPGAPCAHCGLPMHGGRRCPAAGAAFTLAWSPVAYEGSARALVLALKFDGALALAELMAAQIFVNAPAGLLRPEAGLVPVPLHPARRRRRGFDQAARLAAALARRSGLELRPCLRRRGGMTRQLGASAAERRAPARLALEACAPPPPIAVLVDDVHTTGATFEACARALRAAGSHHVVAVAYARTL